jgi:hypothetical protein
MNTQFFDSRVRHARVGIFIEMERQILLHSHKQRKGIYNLEPSKTNNKLGSLSKTNKNAYLSCKEILRFFPPKNELYL